MTENGGYREKYKAQSFVVDRLVKLNKEQKDEIESLWETVHKQEKIIRQLADQLDAAMPDMQPKVYLEMRQ